MTTINFNSGSFLDFNLWDQSPTGSASYNSPSSVTLTLAGGPSGVFTTSFTSQAPGVPVGGTLSFDFSAHNISVANVIIGASPFPLSALGGSFSQAVNSGDDITFDLGQGPGSTSLETFTITNFQYQYGIPCFNEGSKILSLIDNEEVYVPIQKLKKGDLVKTYKHGYKKIEIIGKKNILNSKHSKKGDRIYRLSNDNYPELFQDLYLTGYHSILVDNLTREQRNQTEEIMKKIYITDDKYRLITCLDNRAELIEDEKKYTIYHFALENDNYYYNYGVYANGLLVESSSLRYMKEFSGMN